jgi:dual specificity MAP kinase phosphatase
MDISPITDYLFVGAQPHARDAEQLKALGITLIISMRGSRGPVKALTQPPLNMLWLRSFDTPLTPIPARRLLKGVQAALPVIEAGGKVFAHCAYGRHRSVVMAAAILIAMGLSSDEAMQLLKKRRALADPKAWYVRPQITRFEKFWRRFSHP